MTRYQTIGCGVHHPEAEGDGFTAFSLCMDNDVPIIVFDLGEPGNIQRALCGEELGTIVHAG